MSVIKIKKQLDHY